MRLISFAVISLLAITVSAYPGLGTFATNDAPQCDKDVIMHKILELTAAHQEQQELIKTLEEPGKAEREEQTIRLVMKTIEKELERTDLPEYERPGLEKHYAGSVDDLKKAESALVAKKEELKEATQGYSCINIKILILEENLKQKEEQDAKSKSKTGASPSSSPHRDILQKQIDETCPNVDDLLAIYSYINEGISKLDGMIKKRAKNSKKRLELVQPRNKFMGSSNKLASKFGFVRCECDHAKELQAEFGWQLQSSLTWGVVQSVWQIFSK
ncbi:hypothetical protein BASA50_006148 [Batrachochytrium salamandrivorans]|uniref:Uncharacterized protein n=1 Tax=Batrachochytrium salamandrivorans TaxID=1357716 RepID=A0ABQ8FAR1_9FUNG|nr:hypothetical protein BASA60_009720 [Batrachochytrium salamandrivorans]KAH6595032.1 hypothetical protein BASA50_006148 [Batrachochytrium salamandrivorans]